MYDRFIAIIKNKVEVDCKVVSKHFRSLSKFSQKICIEMPQNENLKTTFFTEI